MKEPTNEAKMNVSRPCFLRKHRKHFQETSTGKGKCFLFPHPKDKETGNIFKTLIFNNLKDRAKSAWKHEETRFFHRKQETF